MSRTLIIDNGSFSIKAGYENDEICREFPNYVMKTKHTKMVYVSDLVNETNDISGLYFRSPFDKGYLVNWDTQTAIWDRLFYKSALNCSPIDTKLILTEPTFNLPEIKENMQQIVFEEYGFESLFCIPAADIVVKSNLLDIFEGKRLEKPDCMIVVDIGQYFTYVTPYLLGYPIKEAIKRVDVGGLVLSNVLKTLVSYRSWDMMEETLIVNDLKEKICYVSQDFKAEMQNSK
ncbi:hypothetical protein BB560_005324 [Smittium megazygosporum]|uniref:Actin-like protein ARP6 n=1 Tax=Smittium megazygosporum TaxID=133381 RepID=A0A2T9Z6T9_9FUNG|nr:hypothetical protein BB560_005324 [Smittium megazygosporum]